MQTAAINRSFVTGRARVSCAASVGVQLRWLCVRVLLLRRRVEQLLADECMQPPHLSVPSHDGVILRLPTAGTHTQHNNTTDAFRVSVE